jgi:uncharacterized membrane protein
MPMKVFSGASGPYLFIFLLMNLSYPISRAFAGASQVKKNICITRSVFISAPKEKVFIFFSHPENDKMWRSEIQESTFTGKDTFRQTSSLSRRITHYVKEYKIDSLQENQYISFKTVKGTSYDEQSFRKVISRGEGGSLVTYSICFNPDIVKYALGYSLPGWIVKLYTKQKAKKYLKNLRKILEEKQKHQ